jgi:hypothetical protein
MAPVVPLHDVTHASVLAKFRTPERVFDQVEPGTARKTVRPPEEDGHMARQLALLDTPPEWQIDDQTREVGRKGLAQARAALAAADRKAAESRPTRGRGPLSGRPTRQRTAA